MSWKEKVVTAAVFVSSLFGGGAAKASAANSSSPSPEPNTEMQSRVQYSRRSSGGSTYNYQTQTQSRPQEKSVIERWIGNTKDQVKREIEYGKARVAESGAKAVREASNNINRAIERARLDARLKQQDDKRFANEFGNVVCNALVVKYQVDHGQDLMDYIASDVRKDIHNIAAGHVKQVYKLLRRNANEDVLYDYMGNALKGVTYNQSNSTYYYGGKQATLYGNILDNMSLKSQNYTIGGQSRQYTR